VSYTDLNFERAEFARETCGIQASYVEIALPKDAERTVGHEQYGLRGGLRRLRPPASR
jgi:hypothetical protein